jgi:hypothetical protein
VIHQAVAVWVGDARPDNVLKKIADEEYKKKLGKSILLPTGTGEVAKVKYPCDILQ